ncbi:MAG: c-type cytochrome [Steroidobacteraceae bacterium]
MAQRSANDIAQNPELKQAAISMGRQVYAVRCATCHGDDLKGSSERHTPDLTDMPTLHGGDDVESGGLLLSAADYEKTIRFGIRSGHAQGRDAASMPAYGPDGSAVYNQLLTAADIGDVTEYVLQLSKQGHDAQAAKRGEQVFLYKGACYDCHGVGGIGDPTLGATDFSHALFLHGADRAAIRNSIQQGVSGSCPAFDGKLSDAQIRATAVYLYSVAPPFQFE